MGKAAFRVYRGGSRKTMKKSDQGATWQDRLKQSESARKANAAKRKGSA